MLIYVLALLSVAALAGLLWLQTLCAPGTYLFRLCRQLKPLLEALAVAGIACSALQLVVVLSGDYAGTAVPLRSIEVRLRAYRILARTFELNDWQSIAVYGLLILLTLYALIAAAFSVRGGSGGSRLSGKARALAAWFAGIMLFGSLLAGGVVHERLITLEAHAARIEQAYAALVRTAADRLDWYLTTALLHELDGEQWRSIQGLFRRVSGDMKQLREAYPDLYTAADQLAADSRFPESPLIALPKRIAPLSDTAAGAQVDVRLERFAALFAGVDSEDVAQLDVARGQSIAQAIAASRARWSEDNAAQLAQELAAEDVSGRYESGRDLAWILARRTGLAMYEQAAPSASALAADTGWMALPWRFIKLFLDDAVDDEARDRLVGIAQRELAGWLAGKGDWSSVASAYAEEVTGALSEKTGVDPGARRRSAQVAVDAAAAEYAIARAQLAADVQRFAADAVVKRWAALQEIWTAAAARLPAGSRDSAVKALSRMRKTLEAQKSLWVSVALLSKIEAPWRSANAALADESGSAAFPPVAAAIIVAESLTLRSRQFADENRDAILDAMRAAVREHFSEVVGRVPKASEGYKLDDYLQNMFADLSALTSAASQRLSRSADGSPPMLRSAASTDACVIEGTLTTSLVNGVAVASRSSMTVAIPCW